MTTRPTLVVGFARTGQAVARVLRDADEPVLAVDDHPSPTAKSVADALGVELVSAPGPQRLAKLVESADRVVVSPGIAPSHLIFSLSPPGRIVSEIELAYELTTVPIVAVTGTNGKTTVTALVTAMLCGSGVRARAVGNIGAPLIETVGEDIDVAVAEVSSFQLAYTRHFRPRVATWLNFSSDHLDWHASLGEYADAKARIWAAQVGDDVTVANREDPIVWSHARQSRGSLVSFGAGGDFHIEGTSFLGPKGEELVVLSDLPRDFPHDRLNALAALATAQAAGATKTGWTKALRETVPLPHRVEHIASKDGVAYFDDSKATTPSAVVAALAAFPSVVLIAGGRNKGLDLGEIATYAQERSELCLRGVVAIGEASDEVVAAFSPRISVTRATTMEEAVRCASALAQPEDAVLLSPGCASFDWYSSYEERGADFERCVGALGAVSVKGI